MPGGWTGVAAAGAGGAGGADGEQAATSSSRAHHGNFIGILESPVAATLAAVSERRAEVLLVSDGDEEEGWRCPDTGALAAVGPTSPLTGARMDRVDDVVEDAVDLALETGCRVVTCTGNADLDVLGRIGALLRY